TAVGRQRLAESGPPPRATLPVGSGPIWSVRFAPDGDTLALALDDGKVQLWDPHTGHVKQTLSAHSDPVWSIAFSADGRLLATTSDDGAVKLWDTATGAERRTIPHPTAVRAVA